MSERHINFLRTGTGISAETETLMRESADLLEALWEYFQLYSAVVDYVADNELTLISDAVAKVEALIKD